MDILRGNDLRGLGLRHQPLYFVILDVLINIFGNEFTALKVGAALVFSVIVIPFFFLAKKLAGNNSITASIAAAIFAFFICYTEMITWGGNPNFLAFSFMLLALYFIVDLANKPTKKSIIFAGFFLSLVIGTHILAAIFTFGALAFFALLRFIFTKNRKDQIKGNIKNLVYLLLAVIVFSLPYVSFYLTYFKNSSGNMTGLNSLNMQLGAITFVDTWVLIDTFIAIIAIGATGIFWLSKYVKENRTNTLLLLSLFISPLLLFLVTAQPLRWLYFLPIPFLLSFSIYSKNLYADVKQVKKITITLFCTLFMIALIIQPVTMAGKHFAEAASFYQFAGENEVEAFNWIRENTPSDSIFATSGHSNNVGGGGNSYAWWIEGYANRICMFTGSNLEFYSFQFERDEVKAANSIFAGTYAANYHNIEVADSCPAGIDNPVIKALIDGNYEQIITINDAQNQVYFSPAGDDQKMTIASGYAANGVSSVNYSNTTATITVTYEQPDFWLTRSIIVTGNESSVDIVYQITPKNGTLKEFRINVWALFETSLEDCNVDEDSVVTISQDDVEAIIRVVETNGNVVGARVIFSNPQNSRPVANYILEPAQGDLYAHLRITINTTETGKWEDQGISFSDSYDMLKDFNVDYIMLNKYRESEYQRFLSDSTHYTVEFENDVIIIFKVVN